MFAIIATTASTLYKFGVNDITTADQAAKALEPLAGKASSLLFTLGIVGTGLLAIPVLAGSAAYVVSEIFGWSEGLNKSFTKAKEFYGIIIASTVVGLLMPLLGLAFILTSGTYLGLMPVDAKKAILLIVGLSTLVLPASVLPFLYYQKLITNITIPKRQERITPLFLTVGFYFFCYYILKRLSAPLLVQQFILAAFSSLLVSAFSIPKLPLVEFMRFPPGCHVVSRLLFMAFPLVGGWTKYEFGGKTTKHKYKPRTDLRYSTIYKL